MVELFKTDMILEFCKNKKVLHVGACDAPYHIEKAKNGTLLHQALKKVSKEIIGIDADKKALDELRNHGIEDIFYGDVIRGCYEIDLDNYEFDYIIFGDVIEHLDNPGLALGNIKKFMNKNTKLILTTPNCFSYASVKIVLTGEEYVHPDHVFWPSKKTLCILFQRYSLKTVYFSYCFYNSSREVTFKKLFFYKIVNIISKTHSLPYLFFVLVREDCMEGN